MNSCLQTTLACEYASEAGFCMESRCVKILDEILVKAGGSAGEKGTTRGVPAVRGGRRHLVLKGG